MSRVTFKQFLKEFDRSDIDLQKQAAQQKSDKAAYTQGQRDFETEKEKARDPNRPAKGDIIIHNGVQFRVLDGKAVKGADGWKLVLLNMKTKEQTHTDYNNKFEDTGKRTDLGKRFLKLA